MKRKLISVSLALALGLSLAACGSKPAPSGAETPAGELGTLSGPVELPVSYTHLTLPTILLV